MINIDMQHENILMSTLEIASLTKNEIYEKQDVDWFFSKSEDNWELSNMAGGMPIFFNKKNGIPVNSFIKLLNTTFQQSASQNQAKKQVVLFQMYGNGLNWLPMQGEQK